LFLPVECDCRMRSENWFFSEHDAHTVKSLDELMGLYYYSVGRGANLLINIGPDRRGRLPAEDKEALLRFGEKIRELHSDLIPCETEEIPGSLTLTMSPQLVNHVILAEEIDPDCETESFEIRIHPFPYGAPVTVFRGTTIGHKAICPFPTVKTGKVEILTDKNKKITACLKYLPLY